MKNWIPFMLIVLLCLGFSTVEAQKIHAILAGSTNVEDIGKGCEMSLKKMQNALEYIEGQTGMTVDIMTLTGSDFTKEKLLETINNINPSPDDVIFFFSTSHGFNYNDVPSQYAFISAHPTKNEMTKDELVEFGVSLEQEVYLPLRAKGARLTITLAEACNTVVDIPAPSSYQVMNMNIPKRLKELFAEAKGGVIASSSQVNQRSWTDEKNGGIYTNMFIEAMNTVIMDSKMATWDEVMAKTNEFTQNYAANEKIRGGQNPVSETDLIDTPIKLIETETENKSNTATKNDYIAPKVRVKPMKKD